MDDFEKLGVFYLGREYDLEKRSLKDALVLYDSKDLVTHAVCVGMTGSGKTGLCIALLEEALIDGIPAIVVDPKGDLCDLLLAFPDLAPGSFLPWINEGDARKKGLSSEQYAAEQAELWKKGLAEWGEDGERIRRFREAGDIAIYTPGSSAGLPVSILKSFAAPERAIVDDADLLRERVNTTATSLLSLVGIEADPIQSREHILVSTILDWTWRNGRDLDLAGFIQAIQTPPVSKVGVLDLESFYPGKERFALALRMNNLLAAPGFGTWLEGAPLDVDAMLHSSDGKPRISIFSIAHLNDAERMFFVSLLLTQLLGWMRRQSGTTSLRALFHMDEIFGYFPPVANPPAKEPLLTLLKQARAFGLGVVLATQNPVDLDYKGLSNAGTWFIGRLQTERDKERVLDGLEGASASAGGGFDRQKMGRTIAGLGQRVFLMNNVHEDAPVVFHTRWAMSYLSGPLARNQIKLLMDGRRGSAAAPDQNPAAAAPSPGPAAASVGAAKSAAGQGAPRPVLPPGIAQTFIPVRGARGEGATLYYEAAVIGVGRVYFADAKSGVSLQKDVPLLADFGAGAARVDWSAARELAVRESELEAAPKEEASFGALPREAAAAPSYAAWSRDLKDWLYMNNKLELLRSPSLKKVSQPGETERDFRVRLQQSAREERDALVERTREKYAAKIARLEERMRTAERGVEREREQAKQQQLQTAISFGATIFSAILGRKRLSTSSMGRAATTASRAGRILKEGKDVQRAEGSVQDIQGQLVELQRELAEETVRIQTSVDPLTEALETVSLKPKKTDVSISLVALAWVPYWQDERGGLTPAWQ